MIGWGSKESGDRPPSRALGASPIPLEDPSFILNKTNPPSATTTSSSSNSLTPTTFNTEEYFILTDSIRTLWSSLSPPTSLGRSGKVTPKAFIRLLWNLDVATSEATIDPETLQSWQTFATSIRETTTTAAEDLKKASMNHSQFEQFLWKFAKTVPSPSRAAELFHRWSCVVKRKVHSITSIMSQMIDQQGWQMNSGLAKQLGLDAIHGVVPTMPETTGMVVEYLLRVHGDCPWLYFDQIKPILIRMTPNLLPPGTTRMLPQRTVAAAAAATLQRKTMVDTKEHREAATRKMMLLERIDDVMSGKSLRKNQQLEVSVDTMELLASCGLPSRRLISAVEKEETGTDAVGETPKKQQHEEEEDSRVLVVVTKEDADQINSEFSQNNQQQPQQHLWCQGPQTTQSLRPNATTTPQPTAQQVTTAQRPVSTSVQHNPQPSQPQTRVLMTRAMLVQSNINRNRPPLQLLGSSPKMVRRTTSRSTAKNQGMNRPPAGIIFSSEHCATQYQPSRPTTAPVHQKRRLKGRKLRRKQRRQRTRSSSNCKTTYNPNIDNNDNNNRPTTAPDRHLMKVHSLLQRQTTPLPMGMFHADMAEQVKSFNIGKEAKRTRQRRQVQQQQQQPQTKMRIKTKMKMKKNRTKETAKNVDQRVEDVDASGLSTRRLQGKHESVTIVVPRVSPIPPQEGVPLVVEQRLNYVKYVHSQEVDEYAQNKNGGHKNSAHKIKNNKNNKNNKNIKNNSYASIAHGWHPSETEQGVQWNPSIASLLVSTRSDSSNSRPSSRQQQQREQQIASIGALTESNMILSHVHNVIKSNYYGGEPVLQVNPVVYSPRSSSRNSAAGNGSVEEMVEEQGVVEEVVKVVEGEGGGSGGGSAVRKDSKHIVSTLINNSGENENEVW
jgi:hypothetical protein